MVALATSCKVTDRVSIRNEHRRRLYFSGFSAEPRRSWVCEQVLMYTVVRRSHIEAQSGICLSVYSARSEEPCKILNQHVSNFTSTAVIKISLERNTSYTSHVQRVTNYRVRHSSATFWRRARKLAPLWILSAHTKLADTLPKYCTNRFASSCSGWQEHSPCRRGLYTHRVLFFFVLFHKSRCVEIAWHAHVLPSTWKIWKADLWSANKKICLSSLRFRCNFPHGCSMDA